MNIDPKEKEKFNKIAEEWWDSSGKFAPLHKINPLRANYISDRVDLDKKQILDVACGGGLLTEALFKKGVEDSLKFNNIEEFHQYIPTLASKQTLMLDQYFFF